MEIAQLKNQIEELLLQIAQQQRIVEQDKHIIIEQKPEVPVAGAVPESPKECKKEKVKGNPAKIVKEDDFSAYDGMKIEHEKTWFKLLSPACYAHILEDGSVEYKITQDMIHNFQHVRCKIVENNKIKNVGFFDLWKIDPTIRIYNSLVYDPTQKAVRVGQFNTYQPPKIDGKILVSIEEFHEHVASLCNYNKECTDYVTACLADMVQNPTRQTTGSHSRCLIFRGEQGGGKGLFKKLINKILGEANCYNTSDLNTVIISKDNRFACGSVNKLLTVLEEMSAEQGYSKADRMKDYITNDWTPQEIKNMNGMLKHKNHTRYWVFSNNKITIKIEASDRRYVVMKTSNKYIGNTAHFEHVAQCFSDADFIYSVFQYLCNLNITNFKFAKRPITDAYTAMKAHNIPLTIRFLASMSAPEDYKESKISIGMLFDMFNEFVRSNKFKCDMSSQSFRDELKEHIQDDSGLTKRKISTMYYYLNKEKFRAYCTRKAYQCLFDDDDILPLNEDDIPEFKGRPMNDIHRFSVNFTLMEPYKPRKQEKIESFEEYLANEKKANKILDNRIKCMDKQVQQWSSEWSSYKYDPSEWKDTLDINLGAYYKFLEA